MNTLVYNPYTDLYEVTIFNNQYAFPETHTRETLKAAIMLVEDLESSLNIHIHISQAVARQISSRLMGEA